jgi:hypothetical protein
VTEEEVAGRGGSEAGVGRKGEGVVDEVAVVEVEYDYEEEEEDERMGWEERRA